MTQEKILALIAEKRKPLEAARQHRLDLDSTISRLEATAAAYVTDPQPEKLPAALEAERDLPALRSLRTRIGDFDVDKRLSPILDRSFDVASLLLDLATERQAFIEQCKYRLKQFQAAAIFLPEPDPQVNIRLAIFQREIGGAAEALGYDPCAVIKNWAEDNEGSVRSFWKIYGRLTTPKLTLYDDVTEIINPDAPHSKVPSLRNLIPVPQP